MYVSNVRKYIKFRLKLGNEIYQGTGSTFKAAKQNAAATALAQTKYHKPINKPTMKPRPHGVTATQELHELATKKGIEAKFKFLEPFNFEFKSAMRLWSRDEMRGNYKVQLSVAGYEYFGQADLPQQAKHNAAIQVTKGILVYFYVIMDSFFFHSYISINQTSQKYQILFLYSYIRRYQY